MRKAWKNTGQDSAEGQIRFWKIFALYLGGEGGKERDTMSLVSSVNDRIFMKIQATRLGCLGGRRLLMCFRFASVTTCAFCRTRNLLRCMSAVM